MTEIMFNLCHDSINQSSAIFILDQNLDWSKFKVFVDDSLIFACSNGRFIFYWIENIVGKIENTFIQYFLLLFPNDVFLKLLKKKPRDYSVRFTKRQNLDWPKLKARAYDKINLTSILSLSKIVFKKHYPAQSS